MLNKCYKASPKKPGHLLHIQNPTQKKSVSTIANRFKIYITKIWNCSFYLHYVYLKIFIQNKVSTYYVWNAREVVSKSFITERTLTFIKY